MLMIDYVLYLFVDSIMVITIILNNSYNFIINTKVLKLLK